MFYAYGVSVQGTYHTSNGVVCQDAHQIVRCGDNMIVAAVADGLGSEKYTDVASRLAVDTAASYCAENIKEGDDSDDILAVIRASFMISQRYIEKTAADRGHDFDQYDTTLSLAVVIHDTLYYGHSGDSGILVMGEDGAFYQVTKQQRDDMGRVFPLAFEDHWVFQEYEKKVVSVLLATDGMLEAFFPIYIRDEKVNIHVPLASFLMDRDRLHIAEEGEEAVRSKMENFISSISPLQINDDKTIAVVINGTTVSGRQPDEYYEEPDWAMLKSRFHDRWRRAAYPDLYTDEEESEEESKKVSQQESVKVAEGGEEENGREKSTAKDPEGGNSQFVEEELQNISGESEETCGGDPPSGEISPGSDGGTGKSGFSGS